MKICANCEFMVKIPVSTGPGMNALVPACTNPECADPVDGEPILCKTARSNDFFCGLAGKRFKQKQEEKKEGNVIALTT